MPNEFLSRLANIQGKGMMSGTIDATVQAIETAGIETATDVMNQAAQEMNLLSGSADMRTIDENIEQLSKDADVTQTNKSVEELSRSMGLLSDEVAKKRGKYDEVYNQAILSLGAIGGDDATRVMNMVAREQGLTNKEMDKYVDSLNRSIEYQGALTELDRGKTLMRKYHYDEDRRNNLDTARGYIIDNPIYKSFAELTVADSDEAALRAFREKVDKLVGEVSKASGLDSEVVRDALAHMNQFTNLVSEKVSYKKSDRDKSIDANKEAYNEVMGTIEKNTKIWKTSAPQAREEARRALSAENPDAVESPEAKILYDIFKPGGGHDLASSNLIALDRWGTGKGVRMSAEMSDVFEDIGAEALPMAMSEKIDKTFLYNEPKYRGLIIHHSPAASLKATGINPETKMPTYESPYTDMAEEKMAVQEELRLMQEQMDLSRPDSKVMGYKPYDQPYPTYKPFAGSYGGAYKPYIPPTIDTPTVPGGKIIDPAVQQEYQSILDWNELIRTVDPKVVDASDIPFSMRRPGFIEEIKGGKYNIEDDSPINYSPVLLNQTLGNFKAFLPNEHSGVKGTVKEMKDYEPQIQMVGRMVWEMDKEHNLFSSNNIDPERLMRSIWSHESHYNADAKSKNRDGSIRYDDIKWGNEKRVLAYGIGQLTMGTVKYIYPQLRDKISGEIPPNNPEGWEMIRHNPSINMITSGLIIEDIARRIKKNLGSAAVTKDNILRGYHSGMGNLYKSYTGVEELGPEGRKYTGYVNRYYDLYNTIEK